MKVLTHEEWRAHTGDFIALWTDQAHAYALYAPGELVCTALEAGAYPALTHAGAGWFQRLAHDMHGAVATGASDTRPVIEHFRSPDGTAAWPEFPAPPGIGVHQVAVGPVHAGIIEPGHFRFSVIGEQILKLEARLGYAHKGTLALMRGKSPRLAARFAARVSGDATVAHSLAFARAAEAALGIAVPARAVRLRAVMAELERLANHAGDIAGIGGDAGFAFLEARFSWQRERLCAAAAAAFGHRLMMDIAIPGGIAGDLATGGAAAIEAALTGFEAELPSLTRVFETSASLQDRLVGTGTVPAALAAAYTLGGVAGRASGQAVDARVHPGYPPYDALGLTIPVETEGDIAARVRIRLAEIAASFALIRACLADLPETAIAIAPEAGSGAALGVAESFRGPVWTWLRLESGAIADIFIADPSFQLWPVLEHAAKTGILADFPLINKSLNGSYAGVDL
jgi:Ni,Fe-hydrogenase III large subunit